MVTITDLEEIRKDYPAMYFFLKLKGIKKLTAAPIIMEGHAIGFLEMNDPSEEMFSLATSLINMICYFIASLLTQRKMLVHLKKLSFYDSLTGAFNRNALFEHNGELLSLNSLSIIYCDVTGLKQVNDTFWAMLRAINCFRNVMLCFRIHCPHSRSIESVGMSLL